MKINMKANTSRGVSRTSIKIDSFEAKVNS